ncbi:MAG: coenzyme F430 synthase [Halobacteriota archaeon]|nr:coenzyme F430 synthase [Halobacteriota archaeon]
MILKDKDILVVDLTHGGLTIAEELSKIGASVTVLDIYKSHLPKRCEEIDGPVFPVKVEISKDQDYDIIISPVHSPVLNPILSEDPRVVSHHEITGILVRDILKKANIVEITGVKGKTSTASLLTDIFAEAGMGVVSSTSIDVSFREGEGKTTLGKASITPANAIKVAHMTLDWGLDPDLFIFELSLGFIGAGRTGILTSARYDYPVAGKKLSAVACKVYTASYFKKAQLILDSDSFKEHSESLKGLELIRYDTLDSLKLADTIFGPTHMKNALAAMAVARCSGIEDEIIKRAFSSSKGVPGRMEMSYESGRIIINNSNPAMNSVSLQTAIDEVLQYDKNAEIAVFSGGEESRCSHTDYNALKKVIDEYGRNKKIRFFFTGKVGRRLIDMGCIGTFIENIDSENLPEDDILLFSMQGEY